MNIRILAAATALLAASALGQEGAYVQPMATNGGTLRASQLWIDPTGQNDLDSDAIAWEDFELPQTTTVARVRWWGEAPPALGFQISFFNQDPGTIAVQPDMFGAGSGPIYEAIYTNYTQVPAGGNLFRFEIVLTTPLTFQANTRYFLSVVGQQPLAYVNWNWAASSSGPNGTFWWMRGAHMYFHLPESRAMGLATAAGWPAGTAFCFGDGTGTACPCANAGSAGNGCANSVNASGANLAASGEASIAADTLVLRGSGMPNSSALYFQGSAQDGGGAGTVFGDGKRCAGGSVIRLGTKMNVSGGSQYPVGADPRISVRGANAAGNVRTYQCWYRNAAGYCTADTFNLTNGVSLTWSL